METNILISSAGRRVELIQCFRATVEQLGWSGTVIASDASSLAPARAAADLLRGLPLVGDDAFVPELLQLVSKHEIGLIVPTIDTELPKLMACREQLIEAGAHLLASGAATISIGSDKERTHEFLVGAGIPCPQQWSAGEARQQAEQLPYPVVVKPISGSSSVGLWSAEGANELLAGVQDSDIVQSMAQGEEYTVDVWVDRLGAVRSVVPRRRISVRGGEVSKGVTERHDEVERLAREVAEALPDPYGPLTIQVFADDDRAEVIEINPRFGGGYPLTWEAGACTTTWALQDALGLENDPPHFEWEAGLHMLRYDQSLFLRPADLAP